MVNNCRRCRFNPWVGKMEKGMATHSSVTAWRIPWTEGPGGLQSMGSQRVGPNWATNTHNNHGLVMSLLNSNPLYFSLLIYSTFQKLFFIRILDDHENLELPVLPLSLPPIYLPSKKAAIIPLYRYDHGGSGPKETISRKTLFCKVYGLFCYILDP